MNPRKFYVETFLISLAVILLEVSYTRVFSFKLVYYFTYLIIGISLLGLGAGGVFVAIFPRLRRTAPARLLAGCCFAASAAVLIGYFVVARLQLNLFRLITNLSAGAIATSMGESAKLALVCTVLFTPFFAAGIALATIFSTQTERIGRLYFADLLGAGIGCAICVPLLVWLSPPGTIMAAGLFFALGGARLAAAHFQPLITPAAAVALALAVGAAMPSRLPDPVADEVKTMGRGPGKPQVLFSQWSPVFRVDVLPSLLPSTHFLIHDGNVGSFIRHFDGDLASLASYENGDRSYPFKLLKPSPRVAIIGAAGGNEILASLHFNAAHVTAVELNPVTVSLHTTHFADFLGHLADHPRVTMINTEGRSFLARNREQQYDLIWFVAPDSYASMNAATSGAFVLSESYLYTVEMIVESLESLTPDGVICTQFGEVDFEGRPNRTARYLGTAREAFRRLNVRDYARHVLVGTSPGFDPGTATSTILLKRAPFTDVDVEHFVETNARLEGARVRHTWREPAGDNPIGKVISLPDTELEAWYRRYPYNVGPVEDDSPFFWHFVRFRDATLRSISRVFSNPEEGMGERLLLLFLCVATAFATAFLLVPLLAIRDIWGAIPYKLHAGIYFAALGLGFMFLEVSLIQRLTLFLGYPTYSLTVTLFALLIFTGLGSALSGRYGARRNAALLRLGVGLILLVFFYARGLTPIITAGVGWSLGLRVALTVLVLAPLGLCLGSFMPLGLRTVAAVSEHGQEFVAWSWAVNGFFSVVSSVLATILSMVLGFHWVMLVAVAVYLVGIGAMMRIPAPAVVDAGVSAELPPQRRTAS